jgi:beta-glucosidase
MLRGFVVSACLGIFMLPAMAQEPAYKNPRLSIEQRADDLVSKMTLEEKISQMVNDAPAIPRLDIPQYNWWNECLHGVGRAGLATVFPQAIGLAATFDADLMYRVAIAISDEARAKHHEFLRRGKRGIYQGLTFWSPNINLFRDPRWGRGMETYGEDPYLTGRLAINFIRGLQGNDPHYLKLVATAKHYAVHSGPEPERHTFNAIIDERDLRETYLPQFEAAVKDGGAWSVMCAYSRWMNQACCASPVLLDRILRNEWGFKGYIVSDCGAINDIFRTHKIVETSAEAAAMSVKAGTDLECGTAFRSLKEAAAKGYITEKEIDTSVKRLFAARFKLGMFDPPEMVPYAKIPYKVVDSPEHARLALEAARRSIVLLKNEKNMLPLRKNLGTIAVIGPNADDVEVLLGNYNGTPSHPVTPLAGIREKVGAKTNVLYSMGCPWAENLPSFEVIPASALFTTENGVRKNGLKAEYFDDRDIKGQPVLTRIDPKVDYNWWDGTPDKDIKDDDNFGVRWTGELVPPVTGDYFIGGWGLTGFRIYLDDKLLARFENVHHAVKTSTKVTLEAGKSYPIRIEYFERAGDAFMSLLWAVPGRDYEKEAVEAAKKADAVVMFVGLSPRLEGEEMNVAVEGFKGGDRMTLNLPAIQENLMRKVYALGKPTVLVLLNGSALAVNWADDHIPAILTAWYPGQAAGTAIADVLFGDFNPAGRLPVTYYRSVEDLPPFEDYNMAGRTYRYFKSGVLYPFGHGLSYTNFKYSKLVVPREIGPGQSVTVTAEVENAGERGGEEVVQLYLSQLDATVPAPIRLLKEFQRISIGPGGRKKLQFTITPGQMSVLDKNYNRVVEPGFYEVAIGGKQPGFEGTADASTTGVVTGRFVVREK